MRVVHVNAWQRSGGAARAARRLHLGLLDAGVDSRMLVRHREDLGPTVDAIGPRADSLVMWKTIAWRWVETNRSDLTNTWFSLGQPGADVFAHPWIEQADVINLHWVPWLLTPRGIAEVVSLGKPVVWTFHDEWAYTGGCHYTCGCERWRDACDACPQLAHDPLGIVRASFADKRRAYGDSDLTVVAPSRWLARRSAESAIFRGHRHETIPYGIELEVFDPAARDAQRARLGVGPDTILLLFAASDARERRKGFDHLVAAMARVARDPRLASLLGQGRIRAVTMGLGAKVELPVPTIGLGLLDDDRDVAAAIAACDLYVIPSLEDNLPNGAIESLACGTPVAGYAAGGIPEIVEGQPLSLLAPVGDVEALGERIITALADVPALRAARPAVRTLAESRFALARQAGSYLSLYRSLVACYVGQSPDDARNPTAR